MEQKVALRRPKSSLWRRVRKDMGLYLLALPGVCYYILFHYIPMYGVSIAFRNYNVFLGFANSPWVGFANFEKLFHLYGFTRALRNTIIISGMNLALSFPAPIILALAINEVRFRQFKRFVQTAVYLPHFVSWVIISGILMALFSPNTGIIKELLSFFGYRGQILNLFTSKGSFRWLLVFSNIWKESGYGTVLYLAAIAAIDQELYDAAFVDGASRWKQLWHITLPGIRTTIIVLLILRVGQILNLGVDQIYTMYNPAVYEVAEILDTFIYTIGLQEARDSLSTATSVFKSVIALVLVLATNAIAKRIDPDSVLL